MGIAANKFRLLFLKGGKSDVEYKLSIIFARRKALLSQSMEFSRSQADNIFQNGPIEMYDGETPGVIPGFPGTPGDIPEDPIPTGDYEEESYVLHAMDRELELDAEQLKVLIETYQTEIEAVDKLLSKNIEKSYDTFKS